MFANFLLENPWFLSEMSDATGKVILAMFLNGLGHTILPALGFAVQKSLYGAENHTNLFVIVILFSCLASALINFISISGVQSGVCGKVFQSSHILTLSAIGAFITFIFLALALNVGFLRDIIASLFDTPIEGADAEAEAGEDYSSTGKQISYAFYSFWAGMYSIAILSWYAVACPSPEPNTEPVDKMAPAPVAK